MDVDSKKILKGLIDVGDLERASVYNSKFCNNADKDLAFAKETFGEDLDKESYFLVKHIRESLLDEKTQKLLKLKSQGNEGVLQLREAINKFKQGILIPNLNLRNY